MGGEGGRDGGREGRERGPQLVPTSQEDELKVENMDPLRTCRV